MKKTKKTKAAVYQAHESPIIQLAVAFIVVAGMALIAYTIKVYLP